MINQLATKNAHQHPSRSRWFASRSRAARVLLFGWLFFWIVGIVQPCCIAFAGSGVDHGMNQTMSASEEAQHAGMSGDSGHENDQCPWAFTAGTAPPGELSLLPTKADFTPHLVVVSQIAPFSAVTESSNSLDLYHPSPLPRIYLRTQRLLI